MSTSYSFEITRFKGAVFAVKGTDIEGNTGKAVLYSPTWAAVLEARKQAQAQETFDLAVREFFAPVTAAADAAAKQGLDFRTVTVVEESPGVVRQAITLDREGEILNILDQERGDLLLWLDEHTLGAIEE
jgi:hypothetical protein